MSKPTHTPGPWIAAAGRSSIVGRPVVAPNAMGRSVCNVHGADEEAEANAHLIASSPELLATAIEGRDAMTAAMADQTVSDDEWQRLSDARDRADAAIAKAEGSDG